MSKENNNLLEQAIYGLLGKLPYYGCLIQSMKVVMGKDIPTAGVRFDENGASIRLTVNPDFFASLTESERIALLIHEASHVDRLHLIRIPQATSNLRLGNIAADAAINCYIPGLPKGGIYPKQFRLKNYQSFEFYLARLTDEKPKENEKQENSNENSDIDENQENESESENDNSNNTSSTDPSPKDSKAKEIVKKYVSPEIENFDVHDWHNSPLTVSEQAEVIESTMLRALEKLGLDAGLMPAHVEESLRLLRELKTKAWHQELRKFLGKTVNGFNLERTFSRRNRRYGLNEAGVKVSGQKKLAIAFDTSGSMSQSELERCLAETMAMVKTGVMGHLIQFDTEVNGIERLRRNTEIVHIKGRGGTSFTDLMNKVDALHCDGLIVFTDGADSDTCEKPKTPILWVYTQGMNNKYDWGFKTVLDK